MAFEERIDVNNDLHDIRTSAIKNRSEEHTSELQSRP